MADMTHTTLAIDTSTETIRCALFSAGAVSGVSATRSESRRRNVAVLTAELLQQREIAVDELAAVVVVIGPGSFTGLRVGLSFAKGLVAAQDIPLVGVTRFEQALYQIRQDNSAQHSATLSERPLYLAVRMKPDEFYCCAVIEGKIGDVDALTMDEVVARSQTGVLYVIGHGAPGYADIEQYATIELTDESLFSVAAEKIRAEALTPWTELEPLYVLRSAAEIKGPKTGATRMASAGSRQRSSRQRNAGQNNSRHRDANSKNA